MKRKVKKHHVKTSFGSKVFDVANVLILLFAIAITLYPMLYTLFASFSDARQLLVFDGLLTWPLKPYTLEGYRQTFLDPNIWNGFYNTIWYVLVGTAASVLLTIVASYISTNKHFVLRGFMMKMLLITMFFSGGMIPTYLVVSNLGLIDSRLAMILPGCIATYNVIILRTFFQSIPASLEESAMLDGANEVTIMFRIIIPLSMPAIAVITLYYSVSYWNSWYPALLYFRDRSLYPLQMFLRERLITEEAIAETGNSTMMAGEAYTRELVKYCTVIVTTVPILAVYPFLQKYFVKGVMIGAIKG
ncbi:MAG TPA: carbohydrate ABC transporter permease [Candidatus Limiplasma sp.]|nr:carbohydrate ABC transporter permease [Candidatus Limiplasma sp.]